MSLKDICLDLIQELSELVKALPASIPLAKKEGKVQSVITSDQKETSWETFNYCFDCLYAEHQCDKKTDWLPYMEQGKYSLDAVIQYLRIAACNANTCQPSIFCLSRPPVRS